MKILAWIALWLCCCLGAGLPKAVAEDQDLRILFEDKYDSAPNEGMWGLLNRTKAWTEEEREALRACMAEVKKAAPGIFHRATAYRPIRCLRVTASGRWKKKRSIIQAFVKGAGVSHAVFFTDNFVKNKSKTVKTLIHELVHLIDVSAVFSQSSEWRSIVQPRIDRLKQKLKDKGEPYHNEKLGLLADKFPALFKSEGLPSFYSCFSLGEALAEAASLSYRDYRPPADIKAYLEKHILSTPYKPQEDLKLLHNGLQAYIDGTPDETLKAMDRYLELKPAHLWAHKYRALAWIQKTETIKALAAYAMALQLPTGEGEMLGMINIFEDRLHGLDDFGYLMDLLNILIKAHPGTIQLYVLRSHVWERMGDFAKAQTDMDKVLAKAADRPAWWARRAELFRAQEKYTASAADYDKAVSLEPQNHDMRMFRGKVLLKTARYQAAFEDFDSYVAAGPKANVLITLLVHRGYARERLGELQKAVDDYDEATKVSRFIPSVAFRRVMAYLKMGDLEKAKPSLKYMKRSATTRSGTYQMDEEGMIEDCTHALVKHPKLITLYFVRAEILAKNKQYQKALEDYQKILSLSPSPADALASHRNMGDMHNELKQPQEAVAAYSKAIQAKVDDASIYDKRAKAYLLIREFDKAIADYSVMLDVATKQKFVFYQTVALNGRAEAYFQKGAPEAAVKEYLASLKVFSGQKKLFIPQSMAYRALGQHKQAEEVILAGIKKIRTLARAHYHLGLIFDDLRGQEMEALKYFGLSADKKTFNPLFRAALIRQWLVQKKTGKAGPELAEYRSIWWGSAWPSQAMDLMLGKTSSEAYLKILPSLSAEDQCQGYYYLGELLRLNGDKAGAIAQFKQAVALNLTTPDAISARFRLKVLVP